MERRFYQAAELRAESQGQTIAGYAAVFNSLSVEIFGFRELILPGAFAESIAGDDIRALWQHNTEAVLGRTKAGTLRLAEDAKGLRVEIDAPDTQVGRDALALIARGDVDQMSFGFRVLADDWNEDEDGMLIRSVAKVKLYEVSPVTFPAYNATTVSVRGEVDPVYGDVPLIPDLLRGATSESVDQVRTRARLAYRNRQIQILSEDFLR
jgi:HK97 family phage prohead protease